MVKLFWNKILHLTDVKRVPKERNVKQTCVRSVVNRGLSERKEVCERRKSYFDALFIVIEESNAAIKSSHGMSVKVFEKTD